MTKVDTENIYFVKTDKYLNNIFTKSYKVNNERVQHLGKILSLGSDEELFPYFIWTDSKNIFSQNIPLTEQWLKKLRFHYQIRLIQ